MHVHQNTNTRIYVKMLSFSNEKILLLRLENLAQGQENEFLFIKPVDNEHARFQNISNKNSQFPNANYNKMSFIFIFLKYTYKTILHVVDIL